MRQYLLALAVTVAAGAAQADPVEGVWQTEVDDGAYAHVTMAPCGAALCGVITRTFRDGAEFASPNLGKTLVIGMVPAGEGYYEGQVWRPSNDKIYTGKITLTGDTLKLAGCVVGGLICARQTWTRVD